LFQTGKIAFDLGIPNSQNWECIWEVQGLPSYTPTLFLLIRGMCLGAYLALDYS